VPEVAGGSQTGEEAVAGGGVHVWGTVEGPRPTS
jgi:hypothetical protein